MRLWHEDIIPFLPRSQLLAQWRELNSIFAKEDKHILINYVYQYPKSHLYQYTKIVLHEFSKRGYKIRTTEKFDRYFENSQKNNEMSIFPEEHNEEYFEICFFNLKEKYIRGQKDFTEAQFLALEQEYKKRASTY